MKSDDEIKRIVLKNVLALFNQNNGKINYPHLKKIAKLKFIQIYENHT